MTSAYVPLTPFYFCRLPCVGDFHVLPRSPLFCPRAPFILTLPKILVVPKFLVICQKLCSVQGQSMQEHRKATGGLCVPV